MAVHHADVAGVGLKSAAHRLRLGRPPAVLTAFLVSPGVAGFRHLGRGPHRVDGPSPLVGEGLGCQAFQGYVHKIRISVVVVPVGERQLQGLENSVDVVGAVVAHSLQVEPFQYLQGFNGNWALAPGTAGVNVYAFVAARGRLAHSDVESGKVLHSKQAALLLNESDHLHGNLAMVEEVSCSLNGLVPASGNVVLFDLNQTAEGAGQFALDQNRSGLQRFATGEKHVPGRPPFLVVPVVVIQLVHGANQSAAQCGRDRESAFGQFQRRGNHLLEGHGAVQLQGREPGIRGGGCYGTKNAHRYLSAGMLVEVVDVGGGGPTAQAADLHRVLLLGVVNDDGSDAAKTGVLG